MEIFQAPGFFVNKGRGTIYSGTDFIYMFKKLADEYSSLFSWISDVIMVGIYEFLLVD